MKITSKKPKRQYPADRPVVSAPGLQEKLNF